MDLDGLDGWIVDKIPYSSDYEIRQRADELFSREMLGAVLVGKFTGDYAAIKTTQLLGTDLGYIFGIVMTVALFIYWEQLNEKAQQKKDEYSGAQSKISDYNDD